MALVALAMPYATAAEPPRESSGTPSRPIKGAGSAKATMRKSSDTESANRSAPRRGRTQILSLGRGFGVR